MAIYNSFITYVVSHFFHKTQKNGTWRHVPIICINSFTAGPQWTYEPYQTLWWPSFSLRVGCWTLCGLTCSSWPPGPCGRTSCWPGIPSLGPPGVQSPSGPSPSGSAGQQQTSRWGLFQICPKTQSRVRAFFVFFVCIFVHSGALRCERLILGVFLWYKRSIAWFDDWLLELYHFKQWIFEYKWKRHLCRKCNNTHRHTFFILRIKCLILLQNHYKSITLTQVVKACTPQGVAQSRWINRDIQTVIYVPINCAMKLMKNKLCCCSFWGARNR